MRYEYSQDPDCRLQYTHGVWGGINPQGEIEVNFYVESDKLPSFSERAVEPDGAFGAEVVPFDEEERVINRHIHSRVLFNYHTARALMEWLEEKIDTRLRAPISCWRSMVTLLGLFLGITEL